MKKNFDILLLILAIGVLIVDIFTSNEIIEALAFVLLSIAFAGTVIYALKNIKDERISYITLTSGYLAFMVSIMTVSLFSVFIRYTNFEIAIPELLRYISLSMFLVYILCQVILKRKL